MASFFLLLSDNNVKNTLIFLIFPKLIKFKNKNKMKKQIVLIAVAIFTFSFAGKSNAQDTTQVKLGFMFCPQGFLNLQKPTKAFSLITPLFAVASFSKGNTTAISTNHRKKNRLHFL